MSNEQRKEKRFPTRGGAKGELYHLDSGQYLKVEHIHDVSSRGVGLCVNHGLTQGERVRLGYKQGRVHVHSYGHVAWCAPVGNEPSSGEGAALFMMGIMI